MLLFKLEKAKFKYHQAETYAINNLNFEIKQGESIAIMGGNGTGKTTLFQMLAGNISELNGTFEGTYKARDILVTSQSRHEHPLGGFFDFKVAKLFRDDPALEFDCTVDDLIKTLAEDFTNDEAARSEFQASIVSMFDIIELRSKKMNHLSNGQKKKVRIALELSTDPAVVLIDEFRSNLDIGSKQYFLSQIRSLIEDSGKTVVMAETAPENIQTFINRVIVVGENFSILKDCTPEELLADKQFLIDSGFVLDRRSNERNSGESSDNIDYIKLRNDMHDSKMNNTFYKQYDELGKQLEAFQKEKNTN